MHFPRRMAEVLVEFSDVVVGDDGVRYSAHACGGPTEDGMWHGWLEFVPIGGGAAIRSGRETTQPNRTDTAYWATGLTPIYLEGALRRTLNPRPVPEPVAAERPSYDGPAPPRPAVSRAPTREAVLDPFSVCEKEGEEPLRQRLSALSHWHLVNIVEAYGLSREPSASLNRMAPAALIDRIVAGVRSNRARAVRRSTG